MAKEDDDRKVEAQIPLVLFVFAKSLTRIGRAGHHGGQKTLVFETLFKRGVMAGSKLIGG